MGILGAKNKVIAGRLISAAKLCIPAARWFYPQPRQYVILNKKMVAAHKIESEVKGNHKISVTFADGKKSLLELDDALCTALLAQLF